MAVSPKIQKAQLLRSSASQPSRPNEGSLQGRAARYVIDQLYRERATGTLLLRFKDKRKKIWFLKGQPIRLQSNLVPELSGRMMVEKDWINEADLRSCLQIQKEAKHSASGSKLIGEIVAELHGVDSDEVKALVEQQNLNAFVQALTWDNGTYEFSPLDLRSNLDPIVDYGQLVEALQSLFDVSTTRLGELFERMDLWTPDLKQVELAQMPLWVILAGARRLDLNGIISVRRQNRLYEIVLKYGIPLTLYEGTFGQPRQTIVVRQASDDHEKFFVEQLFKLFSFLTGVVHYRGLQDHKSPQAIPVQKEETQVTKSVQPDELQEDTNASRFMKRGLALLKSYLKKLRKFAQRLYSKTRKKLDLFVQKLRAKIKRR